MRNTTISVLTAALMTLAVGACSQATTTSGSQAAAPSASAQESGIEVRVENQNWNDMRIYVIRDGTAHRLGSVVTFGAKSFRVASTDLSGAGTVQLEARALGSRLIKTSQPIQVHGGDVVTWTLKNNLGTSSITVS